MTIQTNPAGLQFSVDGGAAQTAPQTLSLSQGPHTIAVAQTQAGTAGTQYVFTGWSDSGAASHSITVGASSATYTASFKTQYQLTISASPAAGGTVTPASGSFYDSGTVVNIQATANSGYSFTSWAGNVAGSSQRYGDDERSPDGDGELLFPYGSDDSDESGGPAIQRGWRRCRNGSPDPQS